jgi:cell division protein ZapE
MTKVKQLYAVRLAAGQLQPDPAQAEAASRLDGLAKQLTASRGWFGGGAKVRGLYIWGAVGRGKSMLMDLFFEAAALKEKRRVHFHDFMLETHAFIFEWRKLSSAEKRKHPAHVRDAGDDPIAPAANTSPIRRLLCFDEFHVTQIADAMILGRLFEQLFDRGVTIVATSNRKPSDLYTNGINRQLFLPFIKRLEDELNVIELKSARDYRLDRLAAAPVYYSPLGKEADAAMDAAFARLTGGAAPAPETLDVHGRKIHVAKQAMGVARFEFDELCKKPLGAADYLTLARHYPTILVDHVPKMGLDERNWAARFVTLVDALYESKTKLVMSADAKPDDIYVSGDGAFEFQRTASRLHEMGSADYLAAEREQAQEPSK